VFIKREGDEKVGQPVYIICKKCLGNEILFMTDIPTDREKHMEQKHGLTGKELEEMRMKPKLCFLSREQALHIVDILTKAL